MTIKEAYQRIRNDIPDHITIILAGKTRTKDELEEAIEAGATDIGENYVQEAETMYNALGRKAEKVRWHMIGHLQKNKINKALQVFDIIHTIESIEKVEAINKRASKPDPPKIIPVLIEINIGSELSKSGITPDYHIILELVQNIAQLGHVRLEGLMTMGPRFGDPENVRPYYRKTREIFDRLKSLNIPNTDIKTLSMGMTHSYNVAIEEGSNMIRLGTAIFGERE